MTSQKVLTRAAVVFFLAGLTTPSRPYPVMLKPGEIWLEVPEQSTRVEANTSGPLAAAAVTSLKIHIAKMPKDIDYGSIHTRVNTESGDILMTTTGVPEGILCTLDLLRRGDMGLVRGRNSVEVSYVDHLKRVHYASFLLDRGSNVPPMKTPGTRPARLTGDKYAVIIGVARYQHAGEDGLTNLRFSDGDAGSMRDFLLSPAGGAFPKDNVLTLLNEEATSSTMRSALFTFLSKPRPDDLVVIYFAGHGSPDPNDSRNLYFLTYDTKIEDMGGTAFPMFQFQDVFERVLKAKRVITLVDSCHSFGVSGAKNVGGSGNNLVNQYVQRFASSGERAVLTASDLSELSYEDTKWGGGHGVFTYFLLQGMRQAADINHDGVVTVAELSQFLRDKVSTATGGEQHPQSLVGGVGDIPVSSVAR